MLCALFGLTYALHGQVVGAEDHILSRNGYGVAVLRTQEVVCREHEYSCLGLRFGRQRNVDSHLVAVEVGVVCGTYQRMQLERAALNEDRLERLNAQTVQSRCAVEQHGVLLDDDLERVPNLGALLIDHLLCGLDVVCNAVLNELLHNEGAEQLNGHFLGNAALIDLKIRADNDNATAGVVNALAQQVLTETSLLALKHIRQRLERTGVCAGHGSAAAAVVDKCVNGFLKHALLVAHDDVGRVELDKSLKTVIAVNDAAVQIVEVACCKAAAVELDHGADLGRDDRQNVDYHPLGLVAALAECLDDLKALDELCLLLAGGVCQFFSELSGKLLAVDLLEELLYCLGAHAGIKVVLVLLAHVAILFFGEYLALFQRSEAGVCDYIVCKVQDLLKHSRSEVEQQAHAAGYALEVPDMRYGGGKLYVTHALTANLALCDFNAAAVADLALVADLLVLAAVALPVLGRSENALAEQAVALGLEGAVVDGLGFGDLAGGPGKDHFRGGNAYFYGVKRCKTHYYSSSSL